MKIVHLARHSNTIFGMFGTIDFEGNKFYTIECPWRNNLPNISCIPAGEYECEMTWSTAFNKPLYLVKDVRGRSGVRIHSGNVAGMQSKKLLTHFHGCIGLGFGYGTVYRQPAILNSVGAVRKFHDLMEKEPFILRITGEFEPYGYDY